MGKRPYRDCKKCGKLVPIERDSCFCGNYVGSQIPIMAEEQIDEQIQEETKEAAKYVQRCPNCGTDYFVNSEEERVIHCNVCGKRSIRYVEPVLLNASNSSQEEIKEEKIEEKIEEEIEEPSNSWGELLEKLKKEEPQKENSEHILQLESIGNYGGHSFSLIWKSEPIIIGREAELGEFLSRDRRVSGEHCSFIYKNEAWQIKDENSSNSTLLNERIVSSKAAEKIKQGDTIVLGNQIDSMEFKVVNIK